MLGRGPRNWLRAGVARHGAEPGQLGSCQALMSVAGGFMRSCYEAVSCPAPALCESKHQDEPAQHLRVSSLIRSVFIYHSNVFMNQQSPAEFWGESSKI